MDRGKGKVLHPCESLNSRILSLSLRGKDGNRVLSLCLTLSCSTRCRVTHGGGHLTASNYATGGPRKTPKIPERVLEIVSEREKKNRFELSTSRRGVGGNLNTLHI